MKYIKTISLVILGCVALYFVIDRALPYIIDFSNEQYGDYYWSDRWWLLGHLLGGIAALLLGPFQLSNSFRKKYIQIHRNLGKV